MERKSKLKKKKKSFISGLTNDFLEVQKVSSMVENGVFFDVINAVKQLIEVLKCVYDVTNSETLSAHIF